MVPLLDLCSVKHQQSLDLNEEVAALKAIVCELEANLGRSLQEVAQRKNVEEERQRNKLTSIPEDGNPVIHEHVGGTILAHEHERLKHQGPDQKQELANSKGQCMVECNIDHFASILKNIETRLSNMSGQAPAGNREGSICRRANQKSTDSHTFSGEVFESSGTAHQLDAMPLV